MKVPVALQLLGLPVLKEDRLAGQVSWTDIEDAYFSVSHVMCRCHCAMLLPSDEGESPLVISTIQ